MFNKSETRKMKNVEAEAKRKGPIFCSWDCKWKEELDR